MTNTPKLADRTDWTDDEFQKLPYADQCTVLLDIALSAIFDDDAFVDDDEPQAMALKNEGDGDICGDGISILMQGGGKIPVISLSPVGQLYCFQQEIFIGDAIQDEVERLGTAVEAECRRRGLSVARFWE